MVQGQTRLAYTLQTVARTQRVMLLPHETPESMPLAEADVRMMRGKLHPLDTAICQEICSSPIYGQLGDNQLARLLNLLAQRRTMVGGQRLKLLDVPLLPRAKLDSSNGSLVLRLGLQAEGQGWIPLNGGRLLAGTQAYFLRDAQAYPIQSPAPWLLANWARDQAIELTPEHLSPSGRDALVRDLATAGVPPEDLAQLAVQRGPPERFVLRLLPPLADAKGIEVSATLSARYPTGEVPLEGARSTELYVATKSEEDEATVDEPEAPEAPAVLDADASAAADDANAGEHIDEEDDSDDDGPLTAEQTPLAERDVASEDEARRRMRAVGFRFDRGRRAFVAQDEAALRILDPQSRVFPAEWEVHRDANRPVFHHDLTLETKVQMLPDRGLLDLHVQVQTVDNEAVAAALVDMKDLIAWLQSGQRYVRLKDGSYAAPSARFRQGLRILGDLGADGDRALVSPLCIGLLRAMGNQAALAAVDDATRSWLDELAEGAIPRSVEPPTDLQATLRDYQRRGIDWLMMLHRHRLTGILADDMGLGKTLQTLALLLLVRDQEGNKPSLVVAPTSVVTVWRDEAARFAPSLKLALWYGPPEMRHAIDADKADLVVTSYGILRRDADRFAKVNFRYVILDEAQSAKNAASHNAHAIRRLQSERRLALSGTPLENRAEELWSVFDFLAPGFLGSLRQFRKRYALPIQRGDVDAQGLLRMRMQPLILRRLKKEVATELPDKVEQTVRCEMNEAQRALYDHLAGQLRENLTRKIEEVGIARSQIDILAALTRLRQICCDPALLPAPPGIKVPPSSKLALFEELMREALDSDRCVVVFSQFVEMQRRLIAVIKTLGVDPLWLHGGTRNRDQVVASFQDPQGPRVIVVSLRAGGTGLTLTRADTVMHYDPWWNPAVERQATDRAHRLGQRNVVSVYKLVCARSIEERVLQLAESKDNLARELLGSEGGSAAKHITREDVFALLS